MRKGSTCVLVFLSHTSDISDTDFELVFFILFTTFGRSSLKHSRRSVQLSSGQTRKIEKSSIIATGTSTITIVDALTVIINPITTNTATPTQPPTRPTPNTPSPLSPLAPTPDPVLPPVPATRIRNQSPPTQTTSTPATTTRTSPSQPPTHPPTQLQHVPYLSRTSPLRLSPFSIGSLLSNAPSLTITMGILLASHPQGRNKELRDARRWGWGDWIDDRVY